MKRRQFLLWCVMLACVLSGCSGSGNHDQRVDLTGTYSGTVQDTITGQGRMTLVLVQSGAALTGTLTAAFQRGTARGDVDGVVDADIEVQVTLRGPFFQCGILMELETHALPLLRGTYHSEPACPPGDQLPDGTLSTGAFTLRQE